MKNQERLVGLLTALLIMITGQTALAQSRIFNIPTTDTVAKGKTYFEFDYATVRGFTRDHMVFLVRTRTHQKVPPVLVLRCDVLNSC
jgi:hypothetical protein